jgi:hypothetical protein
MAFDSTIQTTIAARNATAYPERLLIKTDPMPEALVENTLNNRNVVETGILMRVNSNKKIGAAICRKLNEPGASAKPLAANR